MHIWDQKLLIGIDLRHFNKAGSPTYHQKDNALPLVATLCCCTHRLDAGRLGLGPGDIGERYHLDADNDQRLGSCTDSGLGRWAWHWPAWMVGLCSGAMAASACACLRKKLGRSRHRMATGAPLLGKSCRPCGTSAMAARRRRLSAEEQDLWQHVAASISPLQRSTFGGIGGCAAFGAIAS